MPKFSGALYHFMDERSHSAMVRARAPCSSHTFVHRAFEVLIGFLESFSTRFRPCFPCVSLLDLQWGSFYCFHCCFFLTSFACHSLVILTCAGMHKLLEPSAKQIDRAGTTKMACCTHPNRGSRVFLWKVDCVTPC